MPAGRKQVAFDLDTEALRIYYPSKSWNNAYEVIKRHMVNNDFNWLQGSVYVSKKPITSAEVTIILDELVARNPWLNLCMRDCRETNIGREHDKNHIFDKTAEVRTREEIKAEKELADDPFFSDQNMNQLRRAMEQLEDGRVVVKTIEELEALEKS